MSAVVEQSRRKPTWLLGETGNPALEADSRIPPNQKNAFGQERNCSLAGLIYFCQGTVLSWPLHRHTTCLPEIRFMPGILLLPVFTFHKMFFILSMGFY